MGIFSPKVGSLERNTHIITHQPFSLPYDPDLIPDFHPEPTIYQFSSSTDEKTKEMQEECIYDFGGADVKSCAHKQQFFVQNKQVRAWRRTVVNFSFYFAWCD